MSTQDAFEQWYKEDSGLDISRCWDGESYTDPDVENDWQIWLAAIASYKAQL